MQSLGQRVYLLLASLIIAALAIGWVTTRVVPTISDASRIVVEAANAENTRTYVADVRTFTMYRGKGVTSYSRVYHTPTAERVEYFTGPLSGCTTITRGGKSVFVRHGRPAAITKTASPISPSYRLALLLKNYRVTRAEDWAEPNRACYVVVLAPKRGNGHDRKLWIDKKTHIVLRNDDRVRDSYFTHGYLTSSSLLQDVSYPKTIPARLLALPVAMDRQPASEQMSCDKLSKQLKVKISLPKRMADGYVFDSSCLYRCRCNCGHQSAQLIYTNGMDSISVFETASLAHCGGKKCDLKGGLGTGDCALNSSRQDGVAVVRAKDKMVVVVGDLGGSELMRIARSIP
jgi:negative regulator of sigma E activity